MAPTPHHSRFAREREHFDRIYADEAATGNLLLPEAEKRRYATPPRDTTYSKEYYYHLLGPLHGKKVLEIACGSGFDVCLTASYGAEVYAYDLSAAAIDMARQRAEVNEVSDRIHFQVCDNLTDAFRGEQFDVVMGFAVLHHLPLQGLARHIYARIKVGGMAAFVEPVVNSRLLAYVRTLIPYRPVASTEDEHPLNDGVIAELAEPFSRLQRRDFECVSRLYPLFRNYRRLVHAVHGMDYYLMKVKPLRRFASVVVFGLYRDV
jgi:2-polyprenyl-3-methyl-5-hydroxy-6-metoxy-1,4-benzoquinol methylase